MATTVTKTIKSSGGDYTSLSAWEAANQGNLVTADEVRVAECYAFSDTAQLVIDGSTTDSTRYMRVVAASGAEAQMPWNTSTSYRLSYSGFGFYAINIADDYARIERIQIEHLTDDNNLYGINCDSASLLPRIIGCHIRVGFGATNFGSNAYGIHGGTDSTSNRFIINCFIMMGSRAGAASCHGIQTVNHTSGKTYVYNTTIIGGPCTAGRGIEDVSYSDTICKNVLASNNLGGDFLAGGFTSNYTTCASSDGSAIGTGARTSQTFTFVSSTDYHLASGDAGAKGFGTDLSADATYPFSDDFDLVTRSGSWDIGADQTAAAATAAIIESAFDSSYSTPFSPNAY